MTKPIIDSSNAPTRVYSAIQERARLLSVAEVGGVALLGGYLAGLAYWSAFLGYFGIPVETIRFDLMQIFGVTWWVPAVTLAVFTYLVTRRRLIPGEEVALCVESALLIELVLVLVL